ncbi:MAG TPA: LLM class flavin-dependent oxidoreductase [Xanthobacteraceae bacterium]|nr:LLM class flavin-dependent oxidoreductase [Xanthobacteraceae bacterium]
MKFGIFLPNGSNGYIISRASPQYSPTFAHNKAIAIEAERQGFHMILSMMKYRGFGGETGFWDGCLETFTLMGALAAVTNRVELYPSVTLLAHHPAVVARMVATIDDISEGRCGLNIVTGWNRPEYVQMGLWRGNDYFEQRYQYAREYVQILKQLWRDGTVTCRTEHFTLEDCHCYPQPRREIPLVSAGQSEAGFQFVAEYADESFMVTDRWHLKEKVDRLKAAGAGSGRKVGGYALFQIISAETESEANKVQAEIVHGVDLVALGNMLHSASLDSNKGGSSEHHLAGLSRTPAQGHGAFMSIPTICGSYESVAEQLDEIVAESGIDGCLFSFPDFVEGIRDFGEHIYPRLSCTKGAAKAAVI